MLPGPKDFESLGVSQEMARDLSARVRRIMEDFPHRQNPGEQVRLWHRLREAALDDPNLRWNFEVHRYFFDLAYEGRRATDGPGPAWSPSPTEIGRTNLGTLIEDLGHRSYEELHAWSVSHRQDFWANLVRKLKIAFQREPDGILEPHSTPTRPEWLPGARLNIAESCLQGDPAKVAIVSGTETSPEPQRMTYGELRRLTHRVANGLGNLGVSEGERVALFMPMTPESVAIYLGVILAGCTIVGIADASASAEFGRRARIAGANLVFTSDSYVRGGKDHEVYRKVVDANGPRAIVLPTLSGRRVRMARPGDLAWDRFLSDSDRFEPVARRPGDLTNILFSSGTTKDPKAIPWTHTTPIKSAADAYLHHDVHPADVLAWPTSFGWMMGPWLTYGSLVNRGSIALFVGDAQRREFGTFVEDAAVTILGVVPKLVRSWKAGRTMEGLDWGRVRLFSSTAEPSTPAEMLYLMFLAGYKPVVEYCGGTEIGGGYITGTIVQPCAPSTFTTPALGLDFVILDGGRAADRGEVFLVPPSIGLSTELLNYDHDREYYANVPRGPRGEVLRRHGDQIERLHGGLYRHHGRIDDMINIGGVKTSSEEIRSVIGHDLVYDAKPVAVDVDGSGQHVLIVYVVPRDSTEIGSPELRDRLRRDFGRAIKERLNPLLAHVHDVVLVAELPQAGPGKTRTVKDLGRDYLARAKGSGGSGTSQA